MNICDAINFDEIFILPVSGIDDLMIIGNFMKAEHIYKTIRQEKVIVIVRGVKAQNIIAIADAVFAAGIKFLEITCNTSGVFEMIKMLREKMGNEMHIGAGTVITTDLCRKAIEAGAEYIIAPDVNPDVINYCVKNNTAVIPGAATATEVLTAKRYGAKMVKIFPAAAIGIDYIKALRGPIDDIDFIAVGGVRPENTKDFFNAGCVGIAVGESIVRKEYVEKRNWEAMTDSALQYVRNVNNT